MPNGWRIDRPDPGETRRRRLQSVSARVCVAALVLAAIVVGGFGVLVLALVDQRAAQSPRGAHGGGSGGGVATGGECHRSGERQPRLRDHRQPGLPRSVAGGALAHPGGDRDLPRPWPATPTSACGWSGSPGLSREYQAGWSKAHRRGRAARCRRRPDEASPAGGASAGWTQIRAGSAEIVSAERSLADGRRKRTEAAANLALALALGCALGSALLIIGFAAYLRGPIVRPIRRVAATAERFAGGDRTARASTGGTTEVDLLARSFNDMAGTVQAESAERARVQAELRERGDGFRSLAENSPDVVVRVERGDEHRLRQQCRRGRHRPDGRELPRPLDPRDRGGAARSHRLEPGAARGARHR